MKAALYARVSTNDGRQSADTQLVEHRAVASARGWEVYREYVDQVSGAAGARAALEELMRDARARRFRVVLVFALDRLTREGVLRAFQRIEELKTYGVDFASACEPQFTTSGPYGELFLALAAWMAKQERERLQNRVQAGLARARADGKTFGRPKVVADREKMLELRARGWGYTRIAAELGIKRTTVRRRLAE